MVAPTGKTLSPKREPVTPLSRARGVGEEFDEDLAAAEPLVVKPDHVQTLRLPCAVVNALTGAATGKTLGPSANRYELPGDLCEQTCRIRGTPALSTMKKQIVSRRCNCSGAVAPIRAVDHRALPGIAALRIAGRRSGRAVADAARISATLRIDPACGECKSKGRLWRI